MSTSKREKEFLQKNKRERERRKRGREREGKKRKKSRSESPDEGKTDKFSSRRKALRSKKRSATPAQSFATVRRLAGESG